MATSIVFTFIGTDKPGLVETLSNTVSDFGGNWLESRMSQLAGQFAGIARVQIATSKACGLTDALEQLNSDGLNVVVQTSDLNSASEDQQQYELRQHELRQYELSLVGNDRPNIVKELSGALAAHNINVCEMNTDVTSAPMTAESLFRAQASIQVPSMLDINQLNDELDAIAEELDVDIRLES
jgi:glycine cleavage system regulatory protein